MSVPEKAETLGAWFAVVAVVALVAGAVGVALLWVAR